MIGEAGGLNVDVQLPPGVGLRTVTDEADIRAMSAMQDQYSRPLLERSGLVRVSSTTPYR